MVDVDRNKIRQVVDNLISNAVKYSPRGSIITVLIHANETVAGFAVSDSGPGIPEHERHKLFKDYGRLSAQPTGGEKSTGLGLAICRKIVEAHNGTIGVENIPGRGAEFFVSLPLLQVNFNGSILLVDDEAHITEVHLAPAPAPRRRAHLRGAATAVEAIEVFKKDSPDLVMLDVNMPVMDGIETLRALKAINPDCVVVMLTSLANRQTIDDAAALGAANYIRKDAPPEDIGRALSDTIDSCFESDDSEAGTPPPEP